MRPRPSPNASPMRSIMSACWASSCSSSKDGPLLVNEIAPRVHNSGHWTQRGLHRQPVRAAHPRRGRLAAGRCRATFRCRDGEHHRRGSGGLADARGQRRRAASLRQARDPRQAARWATSRGYRRRPPRAEPPRMSVKDGQSLVRSFTSALNFSKRMTSSMRLARKSRVSSFVLAVVGEPAHQRGRIDARQDRALGIEVEIGRGVAGRAPHRIDGAVEQLHAERGMRRQRQKGGGAAGGFLVRRAARRAARARRP